MDPVIHPQMPPQNPLKQFFRQIKLYMKIPSSLSSDHYYKAGSIAYTESGEIGILPMTGKDELALKNPDALLNGEALIEVITSCVPAVKNPRELLTNDIDALITAIRYATYNDTLETELKCPNCGHDNVFKLDLQYALDNMSYLETDYFVNLDNGLTVFLKPYNFPDLLKALHAQFEQAKLARAIESETLTDEKRSEIFSKAFKDIAVTKFDLMCSAVTKVVGEQQGLQVTEKRYIKEFLQNIDKKSVDKISDLIEEINKIGIKRTFGAKCEKCEHTWESEIDFNPVNFS
jgi:DNA-directed RNA polymerase subunit M/transcription elongation factor TFIIS